MYPTRSQFTEFGGQLTQLCMTACMRLILMTHEVNTIMTVATMQELSPFGTAAHHSQGHHAPQHLPTPNPRDVISMKKLTDVSAIASASPPFLS